MLSFNHQPASLFSTQPILNDFDRFFDSMSCRSITRHPAFIGRQYYHPYYRHSYRPQHRQSSSRRSRLANLLDFVHNDGKRVVPQIQAQVVNTPQSFQLIFRKDYVSSADFSTYVIRYVASDQFIDLIIESDDNQFGKTYRFPAKAVDLSKVEWRVVKNALVIDVPKTVENPGDTMRKDHRFNKTPQLTDAKPKTNVLSENQENKANNSKRSRSATQKSDQESAQKPELESAQKLPHKAAKISSSSPIESFPQNHAEKPMKDGHCISRVSSKTNQTSQIKPKSRIISIPIEFIETTENVVPHTLSSESSSESKDLSTLSRKPTIKNSDFKPEKEILAQKRSSPEITQSNVDYKSNDEPLPKMPKLNKVTLENIEDGSFIVNDLN